MRISVGRTLLSVRANEHDHERFTALFDEWSPRVFAYARRHCDPDTAQDVVSETFLVAWRRLGDIADPVLPWLLVVARNTIFKLRRHEARQDRLTNSAARLAHLAGPGAGADYGAIERAGLLGALNELRAVEREALLLVAWDGLSGRDAAVVAGCTLRAFEVRLSRARARLNRASSSLAADRPASERAQLPRHPSTRIVAIEEKL